MASARVQPDADKCFAVRFADSPIVKARPAHTLALTLDYIAFVLALILEKQILKMTVLLLRSAFYYGKIGLNKSFFGNLP